MMENKRLLLIPIDIEMIDALLESNEVFFAKYGYINDGGEYLTPSIDYLYKIKNRLLEHPEEYPFATDYLIIIKDIKTIIGSIDFKYLPINGVTEIGYGMSKQYEGHGYMSEAVALMLDYAKNSGVNKVIADTLANNIKSQNVLKRNGFIFDKAKDNMLYFFKEL